MRISNISMVCFLRSACWVKLRMKYFLGQTDINDKLPLPKLCHGNKIRLLFKLQISILLVAFTFLKSHIRGAQEKLLWYWFSLILLMQKQHIWSLGHLCLEYFELIYMYWAFALLFLLWAPCFPRINENSMILSHQI